MDNENLSAELTDNQEWSRLSPASVIFFVGKTVGHLFKDAAAGDYRLEFGSEAIDAGSNSGIVDDITGKARPQDGDGAGAGATGDGSDYDIGAYEASVEMCTL